MSHGIFIHRIDLFDSMLFANRIERTLSSRGKIGRMLDLDVARVLYRTCVIEHRAEWHE